MPSSGGKAFQDFHNAHVNDGVLVHVYVWWCDVWWCACVWHVCSDGVLVHVCVCVCVMVWWWWCACVCGVYVCSDGVLVHVCVMVWCVCGVCDCVLACCVMVWQLTLDRNSWCGWSLALFLSWFLRLSTVFTKCQRDYCVLSLRLLWSKEKYEREEDGGSG